MPLRYSPKPIADYDVTLEGGIRAGPGQATFLQGDVQAWNLAFLSHPYEKRAEHPDPQFTILVRRTVGSVLKTGSVDVAGSLPAELTVRSLLKLPAQDFADEICRRTVVSGGETVRLIDRLPLYLAYGDEWLYTVLARADLCLRAPVAGEFQPGDEVGHINDAAAALKKFTR